MPSKFDSYVLHIEQDTLDRLNDLRDLIYDSKGKAVGFDLIIRKALGRYKTAIKYNESKKGRA